MKTFLFILLLLGAFYYAPAQTLVFFYKNNNQLYFKGKPYVGSRSNILAHFEKINLEQPQDSSKLRMYKLDFKKKNFKKIAKNVFSKKDKISLWQQDSVTSRWFFVKE